MNRFYLLLILAFSQPALAQLKMGDVLWEDLHQTHYAEDSTAPAAILSDVGETIFYHNDTYGFREHRTRTVTIKIYTTEGLGWADITIPYYRTGSHRQETVTDIEGITYNEQNGDIQKIELDRHDIYQEEMNEHWEAKKFALPNVRAGSIIQYTYTIKSPYLFNLHDWQFQYEIPVRYSEFKARIPAFYEYSILIHGYPTLSTNDAEVLRGKEKLGRYTYNNVQFHWVAEDLPAFNDESFISAKEDYIARLTFQLAKENFPGSSTRQYMETWPKLTSDLLSLSDYGRYLKRKDGREAAEKLAAQAASEMDKAQAIYQYINTTLAWNGINRLTPEKSPKQVLNEHSGNSTDINIVLRNMLSAVGIEAKPVLLSTRGHGLVTVKYPVLDQFNYSVVHAVIDGQEYLLDGTDADLPFGVLPLRCINGYGLVVDEDEERWVLLESGETYQTETYVLASVDPERKELVATINQKEKGYAALLKRKAYDEDKKKIMGFASPDFQIKNLDDIERPVSVSFKTDYPATQNGKFIYVDPCQYSELRENPFKAKKRQHPIDYSYRRTYKYVFNLAIPEGYVVDEVPTPIEYTLDDQSVQFIFKTQVSVASVQLLSLMRVNQTMIPAEQYPQLKALYETLMAKHSESIVLRKESINQK